MKKYIPSLIIILSLLLAYFILNLDHEWGDDWASYLMQAIAITKGGVGEFMQRNTFTMRTSTHFLGPDAYPWGFPTLLAPFTLVCGALNIFCLKFINLIVWALFLIVFHRLLSRRLPTLEAALLLAFFAFSPVLLRFTNQLTSDLTFLFLSSLSLLLILERKSTHPALLGLTLFLAFFVRTNGILLLATLFVTQAWDWLQTRPRLFPGWKRLLTNEAMPYLIFGLLTLLDLALFPAGEGSHLEHLSLVSLSGIINNISGYFILLSDFFIDLPYSAILYGFLLPFIFSGLILNFQRDFPLVIYLLLSYALFIVWPDTQGIRFLFPLLPILMYFAWRGMEATSFALTSHMERPGQWLARGFWVLLIAAFASTSLGLARTNLAQARGPEGNVFDPLSLEMFDFVKSQTPADSVVAFYKPRALRLFTDRDALLIDRCESLPLADYVVLRRSRGGVDQIVPDEIDSCNPSVQVTKLFVNQKFAIYQVSSP